MADQEQLERLQASVAENNGCVAWNRWRVENPDVKIDLTGARIAHNRITGGHLLASLLSQSNLSRVNFRNANLSLRFNQMLAIGDSEEDRK